MPGLVVTNPNAQPVPLHLASATLPAAGAKTNQAAWPFEPGTTEILASVTYTEGAAGGYVALFPMWTTPAGEVPGTVLDTTIDTSAAPTGKRRLYIEEDDGPVPADGGALKFTIAFDVKEGAPGATAFRLLAAEGGVTATPGVCAMALSGSKQ